MRIKTINLKDFKRFNDLTIDLGETPKRVVALVGPNGSGKSSVFDGLETFSTDEREKGRLRHRRNPSYYKKSIFQKLLDLVVPQQEDDEDDFVSRQHVFITSDQTTYTPTSFYIRSAHRFTPRIDVEQIRKLSKIEEDEKRPKQLIDADNRLEDNYERLIGRYFDDTYDKDITGKQWAEQNIENLNNSLKKILDISIVSLGNPTKGEGNLYFKKGTANKFPYENLSAGEKEVVDLVLDICIKREAYSNSVICIDEPELHLNTSIQRKLLNELERIIPAECQIWVATHSIGFLRALQEDLKDKSSVIDFSGQDFDSAVTLKPIVGTRRDWARIFETALEDLTGLLAPQKIIYCEGRPDPSVTGAEQGFDADVYNEIFSEGHADALFVSSGGGNAVNKNALLALKVLKKAFSTVDLFLLKDMDGHAEQERDTFLQKDAAYRMLKRREIENYLFDKEVLKKFCTTNSKTFNEVGYDTLVTDIRGQELKSIQQKIQVTCQASGDIESFKKKLSQVITPETVVYQELESCIF